MDCDLDGMDVTIKDDGRGDIASNSFDEITAGPTDHGVDELSDVSVANGVGKVVRGGSLTNVGPDSDIGKEVLAVVFSSSNTP